MSPERIQKRKRNSNTGEKNEFIKSLLIAGLIYLSMFVFFSFIGLFADISIKNIYYLSLIQFSVSSFITGFISALKKRKNGLVCGIIGALPLNVSVLILSLVINSFSIDLRMLVSFLILIISSAAGGVISVNTRLKK